MLKYREWCNKGVRSVQKHYINDLKIPNGKKSEQGQMVGSS